ncbi:MAG: InlB B-repeat-containing protein [Desulfobacterales bacterium]|nr:InlB B-repeat-containing protein [Desulfobacterales bacterium]
MKRNMETIVRSVIMGLICLLLFGVQIVWAGNIDATFKYAWSENAGWHNWRSTSAQATVEATYLTGYVWAENIGWIKLGADAGGPYANTNATNWGVNRDAGTGALSGYAWSENAGWINFSPTNGGVSIDLATGDFSGHAWSENMGWIKLAGTAQDNTAYKVKTDPTTYPVAYNANGADSGTAPADQTKTHDVDLTLATNSGNLAKIGYTFAGWNTAADGSGTDYAAGGTYTANEAVTLYAKWTVNTYPVTYNANGADSGTAPADQTKTHDVDLTLATNSGNLAKTGYTFAGWNTAADSSGTDYAAGGTYTANEAVTLYAKWTVNTYRVAYNANGADSGTAAADQTKTHDVDLTLATNSGNLAKTGYTFAGWNTAADGSGTDYAAGGTYTANEAVTLYAKWTLNTYAVIYDANEADSGTAPTDQIKTHGVDLTLAENTGNLARTGYTFAGWNTQADGLGTDYAEGALYTADEAVTLYAKWTLNTYAVIYDANEADSGTAPADQIKTHGVDLTLAENTGNLARTGYTFAGWNTQADGLGTDYAEGALYTVNEAVTLYAKWISNHTITVSAAPTDGGTVTGSGTYVDGSTATVNASAESGYVFVHWTEGNTVVSCSQQYMFTVTGNRTLQANFSQMQNSYDITGSARPSNYGMVTGSGSYNHEAIVTMTALPNQGFALTNWIETWPGLAGSCVVSTDEEYSFQATRNRNLTADFRPKALPGVLMLLIDDE